MFIEHQIHLLESFLKDHVTYKGRIRKLEILKVSNRETPTPSLLGYRHSIFILSFSEYLHFRNALVYKRQFKQIWENSFSLPCLDAENSALQFSKFEMTF